MKPRITKKMFRVCENPDWTKTIALDIILKLGNERVQVQIKWIEDKDNKKNMKLLIESARIEAEKYFLNKQAELILKK